MNRITSEAERGEAVGIGGSGRDHKSSDLRPDVGTARRQSRYIGIGACWQHGADYPTREVPVLLGRTRTATRGTWSSSARHASVNHPWRIAYLITSMRPASSSFRIAFALWTSTVFTDTSSARAISLLLWPSAISRSTSRSRSVIGDPARGDRSRSARAR